MLGVTETRTVMLMALRVIRALLGVLALIMLRASLQPGYEYFIDGVGPSFFTLASRLLAGATAIALFFWLRVYINNAYVAAGAEVAPLRAVWTL